METFNSTLISADDSMSRGPVIDNIGNEGKL